MNYDNYYVRELVILSNGAVTKRRTGCMRIGEAWALADKMHTYLFGHKHLIQVMRRGTKDRIVRIIASNAAPGVQTEAPKAQRALKAYAQTTENQQVDSGTPLAIL